VGKLADQAPQAADGPLARHAHRCHIARTRFFCQVAEDLLAATVFGLCMSLKANQVSIHDSNCAGRYSLSDGRYAGHGDGVDKFHAGAEVRDPDVIGGRARAVVMTNRKGDPINRPGADHSLGGISHRAIEGDAALQYRCSTPTDRAGSETTP